MEAVLYRYPNFATRTVLCISTQSGCPCGCMFCLPPGEKILTVNGEKNIDDIQIGEYVVSYDCENNKRQIDEVINTIENDYDGELVEIELDNGQILKLTPNHEVLTKDGWKNAENISENDEIVRL